MTVSRHADASLADLQAVVAEVTKGAVRAAAAEFTAGKAAHTSVDGLTIEAGVRR